jgi:hypothetical protein
VVIEIKERLPPLWEKTAAISPKILLLQYLRFVRQQKTEVILLIDKMKGGLRV